MISKPLLIFDFDGVIIDGMDEYWSSAREACLELLEQQNYSASLPETVPQAFRGLRPWVHEGWEMVLLAAELIRPNSCLSLKGLKFFTENYHQHCIEALKAWHWQPDQLQYALENVRRRAIKKDVSTWLSRHKPFPGVVKRLKQLNSEKIEFVVLTTKSAVFTAEILNNLQVQPHLLFGRESGSKPDVLLQLSTDHCIKGFVEDRRATLERVLKTRGLSSLTCYLASWGYLKPKDKASLPSGIQLLEPKTFMTPLASWP